MQRQSLGLRVGGTGRREKKFTMHSADYAVERCLSVHLSVTHRYSVETSKHILKLFQHRVATPF